MTLSDIGTLRLMPKTLALRAVQRQRAAWRSVRPWIKEQHGAVGGEPMMTFTRPSKSPHTPSLRVFSGHLAGLGGEDGVGLVGGAQGVGFGVGGGGGFATGEPQDPQAETRVVEERRVRERTRARAFVIVEEAMSVVL
ncbi:hypothetical protein QQ045_010220 [Rhodiola kirilowii]